MAEGTIDLRGRDFLDLADFTSDELRGLLRLAAVLKEKQKAGERVQPLAGKTLGMIFEKSSTRTRVSFEVGMVQLGGHALFLASHDTQLGRGEPIPDTARVLSRYVDGIMIRTFSHESVRELAEYATVPVINGLTDLHHPCQVLADAMTILEHKSRLEGVTVAYVGDGNNMANSWLVGAPLFGMNLRVATPQGYECDPGVAARAQELAARAGTEMSLVHDPREAVAGADVIYTDVWASMGQEAEREERLRAFAGFEVTPALVARAAPDYLFMHCLPAHRGEEVAPDVIDGPHSVIFDEAENRLHAQKAILVATMAGPLA
ncbi:ornithine carbamoyltransferase [Kyrpidia tusciae]|uniref:Ornithine carbamoyltransferase n=1 Tax=Kyrpidia tusciae (strain DSM 2912 / NBRC 15312 / T2) TaxID=562970 RepID=D5WRE7_KYRT2|nr:ornithine carbamoyltransferase [Kyrpidia tusciae]ADG06877.1 ornithine carbamoyltransferase [Kyrpidia tusciae DSM 2912]